MVTEFELDVESQQQYDWTSGLDVRVCRMFHFVFIWLWFVCCCCRAAGRFFFIHNYWRSLANHDRNPDGEAKIRLKKRTVCARVHAFAIVRVSWFRRANDERVCLCVYSNVLYILWVWPRCAVKSIRNAYTVRCWPLCLTDHGMCEWVYICAVLSSRIVNVDNMSGDQIQQQLVVVSSRQDD